MKRRAVSAIASKCGVRAGTVVPLVACSIIDAEEKVFKAEADKRKKVLVAVGTTCSRSLLTEKGHGVSVRWDKPLLRHVSIARIELGSPGHIVRTLSLGLPRTFTIRLHFLKPWSEGGPSLSTLPDW